MRFNFQNEIKQVTGYSDSTKVFFYETVEFHFKILTDFLSAFCKSIILIISGLLKKKMGWALGERTETKKEEFIMTNQP